MDLQNFIKESLVQIARGIEDASNALNESTAVVNPRNAAPTRSADSRVYGYLTSNNISQVVQSISFDVAVSVAQGNETKGGIGLVVGAVALGSQGKSDASNSSVSRLQFAIPMILPTST